MYSATRREKRQPSQEQREERGRESVRGNPYGGRPLRLSGDLTRRIRQSFGIDAERLKLRESKEVAEMGARATAQGDVIRFAPGEFRPGSPEGLSVLGHELAHVREQAQADRAAAGGQVVRDPASEARSDSAGAAFASGMLSAPGPAPLTGASSAPVQMLDDNPKLSIKNLRKHYRGWANTLDFEKTYDALHKVKKPTLHWGSGPDELLQPLLRHAQDRFEGSRLINDNDRMLVSSYVVRSILSGNYKGMSQEKYLKRSRAKTKSNLRGQMFRKILTLGFGGERLKKALFPARFRRNNLEEAYDKHGYKQFARLAKYSEFDPYIRQRLKDIKKRMSKQEFRIYWLEVNDPHNTPFPTISTPKDLVSENKINQYYPGFLEGDRKTKNRNDRRAKKAGLPIDPRAEGYIPDAPDITDVLGDQDVQQEPDNDEELLL